MKNEKLKEVLDLLELVDEKIPALENLIIVPKDEKLIEENKGN